MTSPAPQQARVLAIITERCTAGRPCPSYAEIGRAMGITVVAVWKHITALERKGFIIREPAAHRAIQVVKQS